MEEGRIAPDAAVPDSLPRLPKTIDFTVDYLRSGLPRDAYARDWDEALAQLAALFSTRPPPPLDATPFKRQT